MLCQGSAHVFSVKDMWGEWAGGGGFHETNFQSDLRRVAMSCHTGNEGMTASVIPAGHRAIDSPA
ncbi:hypothetical protein SAMN05216511_4766 [Streptomyces sp. KS_16]|nr:hypothetical protein SAMN05216511_4766 [Streptomyces sp. KS_16]